MTHTHRRAETLEERFARLLADAVEAGQLIGRASPSRANSLALTNAEQAQMWALRDLGQKELDEP